MSHRLTVPRCGLRVRVDGTYTPCGIAAGSIAEHDTGTAVGSFTGVDPAQQDRHGNYVRESQEGSNCADDGSTSSSVDSGSAQSGGTVASVPLSMPRRSLQLQFTCGKCGALWLRALVCEASCTVAVQLRGRSGVICPLCESGLT